MRDCEGSGTPELTIPRPDGGDQPLPCPVCGQHAPTEGGVVRVYRPHAA